MMMAPRMTVGSGASNGEVSPCLRSEDRDFKQQQVKLAVVLDKELFGDSLQQQWLPRPFIPNCYPNFLVRGKKEY